MIDRLDEYKIYLSLCGSIDKSSVRLTGRIFILSLASKEPEYAVFVRAFLFGGQPTFARLERKIQPYNKIKLE